MKGTKGFQLTGNFLLFVFLISLTISQLSEENVMAELQYKVAYATYIGGSGGEQLREVIPLPDGSVLVGGQTNSTDLPTTEGVVQPNYAGDNPALGHPGIYGMALDKQGNIVITSATRSPDLPTTAGCFQPEYGGGPSDWFAAKLSLDFKRLLWCTVQPTHI